MHFGSRFWEVIFRNGTERYYYIINNSRDIDHLKGRGSQATKLVVNTCYVLTNGVTIYYFVFKRSISRKLLIMLSINNNKMKVLIIRMKKCWYFIIKLFIVEENILTN